MRKLIVLLLVNFLFGVSYGQSFQEILKNGFSTFYQSSFDVNIKITAYQSVYKIGPSESTQLRYQKNGAELFISSRDFEQLITKEVMVYVDKEDRLLMIAPQLSKTGATPLIGLDSLMSLNDESIGFSEQAPIIKKLPNGLNGYIFESAVEGYQYIEFYFNRNKQLEKLVLIPELSSNEEQLSGAIEYEFTYPLVPTEKPVFSLSRFGQLKNKKFYPSATFQGYEILNQL